MLVAEATGTAASVPASKKRKVGSLKLMYMVLAPFGDDRSCWRSYIGVVVGKLLARELPTRGGDPQLAKAVFI
jgi:hypothetical protein